MRSVAGDYLEAIYTLHSEGEDAFAVTLAGLFGVSRAAASATVNRLVRDGLLNGENRRLELTSTGHASAEDSVRRHRVTERFLTDVLAMNPLTVHEQARAFEQGLTPLLEQRMDARVAYPNVCPHGNPIPRPGRNADTYFHDRGALPLSAAPVGAALTVLAISELAEHQPAWMATCAALEVAPGAQVVVTARTGSGAEVAVRGRAPAAIGTQLLARIWAVAPSEESA